MNYNINKGLDHLLLDAERHRKNKELFPAIEKYKKTLFFLHGEERIQVLFILADIYGELENFVDANLIYNEIVSLDPDNSGGWYGVAFTNELIGRDILGSLEAYEKAIELDKEYKEAYYYAATIYGDLENYKKAIEYLERVIDLDPEDYVAYNDLGSIYEKLKDYQRALKYIKKSIAINSSYYLSHFNLGVVSKALGDREGALKSYKTSTKYSNSIYNYLNMSALYIESEEFDKAIDILTLGIERNPHHILFYNRACSYSRLNQEDKAIEDLLRAFEIDKVVLKWAKNDPDLKNIIQEIK